MCSQGVEGELKVIRQRSAVSLAHGHWYYPLLSNPILFLLKKTASHWGITRSSTSCPAWMAAVARKTMTSWVKYSKMRMRCLQAIQSWLYEVLFQPLESYTISTCIETIDPGFVNSEGSTPMKTCAQFGLQLKWSDRDTKWSSPRSRRSIWLCCMIDLGGDSTQQPTTKKTAWPQWGSLETT